MKKRPAPQKLTLVVTPRPLDREGIFGYLLRLTEANGYRSGETLCRTMGTGNVHSMLGEIMDGHQMEYSNLLPVDSAGAIAGDPKNLFRYLNGLSEHDYLLSKYPSICPTCVKEKKTVEAHWGLQLMVACPEHQVRSHTSCPQCKTVLNMSRPSPRHCRCGYDMAYAPLYPCRPDETALLELIRCKIYGLPVSDSGMGYAPELLNASLEFLLRFINKIGRPFRAKEVEYKPATVVRQAAVILSNWPHNFYDWLRDQGQNERDAAFRLYLNKYSSGFDKAEYAFVVRALRTYAKERFNGGFYTIRRGPDTPLVKGPHVMLAALPEEDRENLLKTEDVSLYAASRYLGLPQTQCLKLMELGLIRATVSPPNPRISSASLQLLEAQMKNAGKASIEAEDRWPLGNVMLLPHIPSPIKTQILTKIIDRRLRADATGAIDVGRIAVSRSEITEFWREYKQGYRKELLRSGASRRLNCCVQAIEPMIDAGYLAWADAERKVVCEKSVEEFKSRFMAAGLVAKECGTSTPALVRECEKAGMPVLAITRKLTKVSNYFVPPEYRQIAIDRFGRAGLSTPQSQRRAAYAKLRAERLAAAEKQAGLEASDAT